MQGGSDSDDAIGMDEMPLSRRIVPSSLHAARAQRVDSSSSSEADDSELNSESEPASQSEYTCKHPPLGTLLSLFTTYS